MIFKQSRKISSLLTSYSFRLIIIVSIILWCTFVYQDVKWYKTEVNYETKELINEYYQQSLNESLKISTFLQNSYDNTHSLYKNLLKTDVYEKAKVLEGLYKELKSKGLPSHEVVNLLKEYVYIISENRGSKYYFIDDIKGYSIVYPPHKSSEGENLFNILGDTLEYREEINMLKAKDEGFIINYWPNYEKEDDPIEQKLSFVKRIAIDNWYIGTGIYVSDFEDVTKLEVLDEIEDAWMNSNIEYVLFSNSDSIVRLCNSGNYVRGQYMTSLSKQNNIREFEKVDNQIFKDHFGDYWVLTNDGNWNWTIGIRLQNEIAENTALVLKKVFLKDFIKNIFINIIIVVIILLVNGVLISHNKRLIIKDFKRLTYDLNGAIQNFVQPLKIKYWFKENKILIEKIVPSIIQKQQQSQDVIMQRDVLKWFFDNAPFLFFSLNNEKRIGIFNESLIRSLGIVEVDDNDSVSNIFDFILTKKDKYKIKRAIVKCDGEPESVEIITKTGKHLFIEWSFEKFNNITYAFGNEITECKEKIKGLSFLVSELEDIVRIKDRFFSIIAHDLKSPFNALMGFSSLLEMRYSSLDDKTRLSYINKVSESSKQMFKLLDNLLMWAQTQTGEAKLSTDNWPVKKLISDNVKMLDQQIIEKKLIVNINGDENAEAFFDKNQIATAFRNILSNAIKYSYEGGVVEINIVEMVDFVTVRVKDYGKGVDPAILKYLFTLEQTTVTTSDKEQGTGLGLLLTKEFIQLNDGNIWAETDNETGSVFVFTLPKKKIRE